MRKLLCLFFAILGTCQLHSNNISWSSPPTVLSGVSFNAVNPQVVINPNGDAISIWTENNVVKSSSKLVCGSWLSAVTVSGTGASSPCLVMDQNGNATAVWLESGVIKASTKLFNSSWSSPTTLSSKGATGPTLCVDSDGDVVAAWARAGNIEASTKLFGTPWRVKLTINSTGASSPKIAVGGSGSNTNFVLVWQGTSGNTPVIYASSKLILGGWSDAQIISKITHNAINPSIAVDSNGNALAVWYAYDVTGVNYSNVIVKSAARSFGSCSWGSVSDLSASGSRNPATLFASVAFDSIGNAIAIWNTSFDDATFNVQSSIKPVNGHWSATVNLVDSNLYAYAADVSVTSFGDVLSLYMFYNGASLMIQSVESDMNGFLNNFWSVPITISRGTDNGYPKIAASINGNTIHTAAVWVNYNGAHNVIAAATGSKTLVSPPSNLIVTQSSNNFGVFTEYYNTLSWHASLDSNVVGYLIFRNGVFLEQVGANVLQFIDDNRIQNGPVNYSVTAIDNLNTQSSTVSVTFP